MKASETIRIRPAKPGEGRWLAEIERTCFPPAEAASEAALLERLAAFPENFLVAENEKGEAVGFINGASTDRPYLPDEMYHDVSLHRPGGAYQTVFGLNVLPAYRRQGIAGRLVRRYIELAQERGCRGVVLTCKDPLIPYYEKFGFRCRGAADSVHGGQRWNDMRLTFYGPETV